MDIIESLGSTKTRTLEFFDLPNDLLDLSYGPGKWKVRQILCHLADAETVLYDRIRRVISEPRQVIWGFDQDAWASGLEYTDFPLEINRGIYSSVRDGIIHLAQKYYEECGSREFVHSETGVRTLKDELDKVVWHNEGHISQIERAIDSS